MTPVRERISAATGLESWSPVDARWRRALAIVDGGAPAASIRRDGRGATWVRLAAQYLHTWRAARCDRGRLRAIERFQHVHVAQLIHLGDRPSRATIEARILGGQSDASIAQANACRAEAIAAYEALFFDVRSRLSDRHFVMANAIPEFSGANPLPDEPALWKLAAYDGGTPLLDAIRFGAPQEWSQRPEDLSDQLTRLTVRRLGTASLVALLQMPAEAFLDRRMLRIQERLLKIKRDRGRTGADTDESRSLDAGLAAMFEYFEPLAQAVTTDHVETSASISI